ncbi:MipA/OmpV family protein [Rouxiella sp. Mn2063]|uniref:MipA/OmpV family protein n=1 Tax=Rouxiella sp. Mn2063 TaxID=3395262 RepID=UPI003BDF9025
MKNPLILSISILSICGISFCAQAGQESFFGDHTDVTLGAAGEYAPRYLGSSESEFRLMPVIQLQRGAMFVDSTKGVGYDLPIVGGFYLEHSLGFSFGRSEQNNLWRDGSNNLRGMGDIKGALNTSFSLGYQFSPQLAADVMATLPLTASQGVAYQATVQGILWQKNADEIDFETDILFGDHRNNMLFYGVSAEQSADSNFKQYNAAGGLYGESLILSWNHQFSKSWKTVVAVDYTYLNDKAANSPIIDQRNNVTETLEVAYSF